MPTTNIHPETPMVKLATLEERLVAQILDAIIAMALLFGLLGIVSFLNIDSTFISKMLMLTPAIYLLFSDALPKGQSLGKKWVNISVVSSTTGEYCTIHQSFFRNILLPFLSILDWIFILGKKRKRLGDFLANTSVIDNKD